MERFGETWKHKRKDENDTGDKNKIESLVKEELVFFEKNLNKIAKDLHKENNEREARER